jgi:hypothetical protein
VACLFIHARQNNPVAPRQSVAVPLSSAGTPCGVASALALAPPLVCRPSPCRYSRQACPLELMVAWKPWSPVTKCATQPFTVELECSGNSSPNTELTPIQPPVQQVKALPACNSTGERNVPIRIGYNMGVVV